MLRSAGASPLPPTVTNPTTGTIYTLAEVEAEPFALNTNLGYYTNFVNLLDLCAWAMPNGFQLNGLPMGLTLVAPAFQESYLAGIATAFHQSRNHTQVRMDFMNKLCIEAEPYPFEFNPSSTALLIIDMQRDFLEPGGFGEMLGNDVSLLRCVIEPTQRLLTATRAAGLLVIHTREGHRPDLADALPSKRARGRLACGIGDLGPMGRVLVRGEYGHDIIPELYPLPDEPVIDKPSSFSKIG